MCVLCAKLGIFFPLSDVLKEFAAKKCVKLGKLLKEGGALSVGMKIKGSDSGSNPNANSKSQNYMKVIKYPITLNHAPNPKRGFFLFFS